MRRQARLLHHIAESHLAPAPAALRRGEGIDQLAGLLGVHGEGGPIEKFLSKKGPGIHHLSFKVPDIEAKCKELKEKGFKLLYEEPQSGAHSCRVNFIHPKSTGGVLIEISQPVGET